MFPRDEGSGQNNWLQNDEIPKPRVNIFTDASNKGEHIGYAFVAGRGNVAVGEGGVWCSQRRHCLSGRSRRHTGRTVMAALQPKELNGTTVKIWTDPQSTLQAAFSLRPASKLLEETIQLLCSAKSISRVELASVWRHSGVTGSEIVDGMAKENNVAAQLPLPLAS